MASDDDAGQGGVDTLGPLATQQHCLILERRAWNVGHVQPLAPQAVPAAPLASRDWIAL